jgi:hypothetical protein
MSRIGGFTRRGVHTPRINRVRAVYDFAVNGGVQGTIVLRAKAIPKGAIVTGGTIVVDTAVTSAGSATVAVQVEGAGDVVATTAKASWTTGVKNVLPADTTGSITAATKVKTTAVRDISIVIATADLTAGKFHVILDYIDPLSA